MKTSKTDNGKGYYLSYSSRGMAEIAPTFADSPNRYFAACKTFGIVSIAILLCGCWSGTSGAFGSQDASEEDGSPSDNRDGSTGGDGDADGDADNDAEQDGSPDSGHDAGPVMDFGWHTFYGSYDDDEATGLAVDPGGNLIIVGHSRSTWNGPADQPPLHAHSEDPDVFILKLSPQGGYLWHTFYGSNFNWGSKVALDHEGNIYVSGQSSFIPWNGPAGESPRHAPDGDFPAFVLKLNPDGVYQWHTFYGSGTGFERPTIAVNQEGDLYLAGYSTAPWNGPAGESPKIPFSTDGSDNIFFLKLSTDGEYEWHMFYPRDDIPSIAVDHEGNLFALLCTPAPFLWPFPETLDLLFLKINPEGDILWLRQHGPAYGMCGNYGADIVLDPNGNIYALGDAACSWNGPEGQAPLHAQSDIFNIFVLKLDPQGEYVWHTFYGATRTQMDVDEAQVTSANIALDNHGRIYITGRSPTPWNGPDGQSPLNDPDGAGGFFVLCLDEFGEYHWHAFYDGESYTVSNDLDVDPDGNVSAIGTSDATWHGPDGKPPLHKYSGKIDIFVLKLIEAP